MTPLSQVRAHFCGCFPSSVLLNGFFVLNNCHLTCILGSIPIWAIHVRLRLNDPYGSLLTQNNLRVCECCYSQLKIKNVDC